MKAAKISHTVVLAKPESAQASDALAGLNPGLASSAALNSTQGDRTVTSATPISPIAAPGSGSTIRATITPAKMAKKFHAWGASPGGGGISANPAATARGRMNFQDGIPVAGSAGTGTCCCAVSMTFPSGCRLVSVAVLISIQVSPHAGVCQHRTGKR